MYVPCVLAYFGAHAEKSDLDAYFSPLDAPKEGQPDDQSHDLLLLKYR